MKKIIALLLGLCAVAVAQGPAAWNYIKWDDSLHSKVHDKFILYGTYLTPPRSVAPGFNPSIGIMCREGKVEQNYISVGTVVNRTKGFYSEYQVLGEVKIDDKKSRFVGDDVSPDGTAVFFTRATLTKILKAHKVILGINEYLGPEVVMQFDMPDPALVLTTCGK